MSENLHEQLLLDHVRHPRGRVTLATPTAESRQLNPTCGDEVTVSIEVRDRMIVAVGWHGHGCSVSQASASLLADLVQTTSTVEATALLEGFRTAMRSRGTIDLDEERFGDAVALNGVSRYSSRVKCAMLPWIALEQALTAIDR